MSKLAHSDQASMDAIDRRRAIEDGNEDVLGLVIQRTRTDCAICCLAMLTGRAYDDVLSAIGDAFDPERGMRYEHDALKRLGFSDEWDNGEPVGDFVIRHRGPLSPEFFRDFAWGRKAILTVPSLNNPGGHHMVYYDGRKVRDPSPQKAYTKFTELMPDEMILFRARAHEQSEKGEN